MQAFDGLIIASFVIVVLAAMQSHEVNEHIEKINKENSSNYHIPKLPTASYFTLILAAIFLFAYLVISIFVK